MMFSFMRIAQAMWWQTVIAVVLLLTVVCGSAVFITTEEQQVTLGEVVERITTVADAVMLYQVNDGVELSYNPQVSAREEREIAQLIDMYNQHTARKIYLIRRVQ